METPQTLTVDIECSLYHDLYRQEITNDDDVNIGFAVFHNSSENYDYLKNKHPNIGSLIKGYWCGYAKVPQIWYEAVEDMYQSKKHPIITENELASLPEITFMSRSVTDGSYILGFDHAHCQDILKYTDLKGVIQEIHDMYNFCWLPIYTKHSD